MPNSFLWDCLKPVTINKVQVLMSYVMLNIVKSSLKLTTVELKKLEVYWRINCWWKTEVVACMMQIINNGWSRAVTSDTQLDKNMVLYFHHKRTKIIFVLLSSIGDHSFSTYAKLSEKLIPPDTHTYVIFSDLWRDSVFNSIRSVYRILPNIFERSFCENSQQLKDVYCNEMEISSRV